MPMMAGPPQLGHVIMDTVTSLFRIMRLHHKSLPPKRRPGMGRVVCMPVHRALPRPASRKCHDDHADLPDPKPSSPEVQNLTIEFLLVVKRSWKTISTSRDRGYLVCGRFRSI